jgi:hypothetical protein
MAYSYDEYNPIETVGGAYVRSPSTFVRSKQDVSASDAGRTEDTLMHKKKLSEKIKLELAWNNISTADASAILKAFNASEYFAVKYLDPMEGTYVTKTFYVGDMSAPMYNNKLNLWSNVSFNIIEQ